MHKDTTELLYEMDILDGIEIEFSLQLERFYSGNKMYEYVSPRNTNVVHVVLSNDVRSMKEDVKNQILNNEELKKYLGPIQSIKAYTVSVVFYDEWLTKAKKLFKRNDLTNIWKTAEDAVCEALQIDDSLCVEETLSKGLLNKNNKGLIKLNFTFLK